MVFYHSEQIQRINIFCADRFVSDRSSRHEDDVHRRSGSRIAREAAERKKVIQKNEILTKGSRPIEVAFAGEAGKLCMLLFHATAGHCGLSAAFSKAG